MELKTLIDRAAGVVGNQTRLAQLVGVSPNRVSDWKQGVRPCPMETQVALCDIAGLDDHAAREHLRAAASVPPPKRKAGALASIALVAVASAASAAAFIERCATMYIM